MVRIITRRMPQLYCAHIQILNCTEDFIVLLKIQDTMNNLFVSLGVSEPILITERTFIPHLFNSATLSLWKADCEPRVALKHMWDEIGDGYKKMGDNTAHGALKQKRSKGMCQEIKA